MRSTSWPQATNRRIVASVLRLALHLAALLVWGAAATASAQCVASPELAPAADAESVLTWRDRVGRVVAPVYVNGLGPYSFVIDTGANHSALSHDLARELGLTPRGEREVHSVTDVRVAPFVERQELRFERVALDAGIMPVLASDILGEARGLLGVNAMGDRRLLIDFDRRCVEIAPSREARRLRDWIAVQGRLRFGNLLVLDGRVDRVSVQMLVDTGSAVTLANLALYEALAARARIRLERDIRTHTAGAPIVTDRAIFLPRLRIGDVRASNITALVGAYHIFELWNLDEEPALLLGMDVLSQSHGVAIDYRQATVYFRVARDAD